MDKSLNQYLDKVDRYLRPMSAADRADIINEIKSEMAELEVVAGVLLFLAGKGLWRITLGYIRMVAKGRVK